MSQESFQEPDAAVLSYASAPSLPSFPKKGLLLSLSMVVAVLTGCLAALVFDRLDRTFHSMDQVEDELGMPPLGLVPALGGFALLQDRPETYVLAKPYSAYAEAMRTLHAGILLSDPDKPPKVVLLTSSLPKEGKTSIALSLVKVQASIGQKAIVVDCDLRRPRLHSIFGRPRDPGLTECLTGVASLDEVIFADEASGAAVLPAGASVQNSPDLLSSKQMKALLGELSERYDLVILDSAPVLAVSDTRLLSRLADKTIYVVRWGKTRREVAAAGIKQMLLAKADIGGVLLSMVNVKKHARSGFSDSGSYVGAVKKYYQG